jgi:hypothetical protein
LVQRKFLQSFFAVALLAPAAAVAAQSIGSGTLTGTVTDQTGAVVAKAKVEIRSAVTGYQQSQSTDNSGVFRFNAVPPNTYQVTAVADGFNPSNATVEVRGALPITHNFKLELQQEATSITVQESAVQVENDPSAHQDVDRSSFAKLATFDPAGQLSSAVTHTTGAVAADANGFFHPVGDHAQTTIVIDGQPISDQQSKLFSTQIPTNALQGMELITGSPDAQYGDKSSLVVNATTRSGLGVNKVFGDIQPMWGSFGTWGGMADLGFGGAKYGNFLALNGVRSGRFLDSPEFSPFHDVGNNASIFDRLDYQPAPSDVFHLNLFVARNWFQAPNAYDYLDQDQKQRVMTWSIAPGYQHTFNANTLLTVNPYGRRDQVNYYPSRDIFADQPATAQQTRFLTNYGIKSDLSHAHGRHNWKLGLQIQQTRLLERFQFGITDPTYNPVCLTATGDPVLQPDITNPAQCAAANPTYQPNPALQPGIVPYDLTRGGSLFAFYGKHNINQYAFYFTDSIRIQNFNITIGLRDDQYNGLSSANGLQPRLGISYQLPKTKTVFRVAYARTFETPFNENLLLSSDTGAGGLAANAFGSESTPIQPGQRNQFNAGFQQSIGRWFLLDADYFWKYTHDAYDFSVFFGTPITFPIAWHNSKLDGVTARFSTINMKGFQAYLTLGHTRARFFPPETGGLVPLTPFSEGVFRIDHDQEYQQNVGMRYQRPKNAEWIDFNWRFDSGLVVSGVPDVATALTLTAAQQVAIGFACDGVAATYSAAISSCSGTGTAALLTLPQTGTANADHNPDRVTPRNLFNLGVGTDNLLHKETGPRVTVRFTIENLTNEMALYNFLSTFSGTHFVAPRTYQVAVGYSF